MLISGPEPWTGQSEVKRLTFGLERTSPHGTRVDLRDFPIDEIILDSGL